MKQQWRQAKLIDHMSLIPLSKITYILLLGHIGFSDQGHIGPVIVCQCSVKIYDFMSFIQVNTARPRLFPDKSYCIQPDNCEPPFQIEKEYIQKLKKHIGIGEVQIDLILTKCSPDNLFAFLCMNRCQKGTASRTHHRCEIFIRIYFNPVYVIRLFFVQLSLEPLTVA